MNRGFSRRCFLCQLQPASPHLKSPPVFVSKFVLIHVRMLEQDGHLRAELWEQPKAARQRLTRLVRPRRSLSSPHILPKWGRHNPTNPVSLQGKEQLGWLWQEWLVL